MIFRKRHFWLAAAIAALAPASVSGAWAAGWIGGAQAVAVAGLIGLTLVSCVSGVGYRILCRLQREQKAAQHHLELLCRACSASSLGAGGEFPSTLGAESPWSGVLGRVRDCLIRPAARVQELEQARAALEIRAQRSAVQSERIETILAGLSEPVLAVDNYDELVLVNSSAEKLFDIDMQNVESRAVSQLVRCEKLVELLSDTRRRKSPSHRSGEIEIKDASGQSRWYNVTTRTIAEAKENGKRDGAPRGVVAVLRDISPQKEIQRRNAEFVSAVSHEMKTPLAGIKAYVELLADCDAEDDKTREEFLEVIDSQADRLQRLVDNLLNLARIEAGVVNVNKRSRPLNELLEEAQRVVQPAADRKNIQLAADLSPMYLGVLADRDMLLQAAINLLSNAVKYTPDGGRVTLRSRLVDAEVRFEVEDTGVGLSLEDSRKVFEKFYRVQKNKDMATGTGLGLPLAKHIVEDVHGGKLTVESILGQGSTFIVMLPAACQLG